MPLYRYGGKDGHEYKLEVDEQLVVLRTDRRAPLSHIPLSSSKRGLANKLVPIVAFPAAGVEVFRISDYSAREVQKALSSENEIRFVGGGLCDPISRHPVVYTENLFVKFEDDQEDEQCRKTLQEHNFIVKRKLTYARNAYFVGVKEGTGSAVFDMAAELLSLGWVNLCHPELIRKAQFRIAYPEQWHLHQTSVNGRTINAHANVIPAWDVNQGEGVTIAIIDSGIDLDHEEFAGAGKIVAPRDVTRGNNDPVPGSGENHGTACAGVACANGSHHASGVAPNAQLMPIRLASGLGSQAEADAFVWAAENGAAVISCSWGPQDGAWWDDDDPMHNQVVALPDSTRVAIDWAVHNGRGGRGCVITWAAGNGHESVENDGYASYDKVIAVAACNDEGRQSAYSDYGASIWCAFPSNHGQPSLTAGIWTTDRSGGAGYNWGHPPLGDPEGNYTNSFGGTSSACPGVAGVAALIIGRNSDLRWDEVIDIIRRSCDRIDDSNGEYDNNGHSPRYGYGRVNASEAVKNAVPVQPNYTAIHTAIQNVEVKDYTTSSLTVEVGDTNPIVNTRITVDVEHTYIGDLIVRILPPSQPNYPQHVILHNRTGAGTQNLRTTYDKVSTPDLAQLEGSNPRGSWTLEVEDNDQRDVGRIRSFSVELAY